MCDKKQWIRGNKAYKKKKKKRQEKQARKTLTVLTTLEKLAERKLVKQQANFIATWSSSAIREARNRFHCYFKAGMQIDPSRYRCEPWFNNIYTKINLVASRSLNAKQKGSCNIPTTTSNT